MTVSMAEFWPLRSTRHHSGRAFRDLADWLAHLRLKGRADRTLDDYERTIAALILWKDLPSSDYTLSDLEHFVLMQYGPTPGAGPKVSAIKGFFRFLYDRERIPRDPSKLLDKPKGKAQKVIDTFSEAELTLIYATDPLAALMCETGIRKSEARNLKRKHINLEAGELVVYDGKGGKDRALPMTMRARQIVADMDITDGLNPDDHLWSTKPGGGEIIRRRDPISNTAMQRWWADPLTGVLARAGVTYRNMHTTRHTFATRLIKRGARLATVKKLMGHSSIQTTVDIYGHLDVEDDVAAISLLEVEV